MKLYDRLHMIHRVLRYRWRSERAELKFMLARRFEGGSVLDIGAHRGIYSYWMHRHFRGGTQIVAFEPQPELVEHLTQLKHAFKLERLSIAPVGLSVRSGRLRMHRPKKHWGAATFDEFAYDQHETDQLEIPVTTVDEYLAERPELRPVRFIKCDVEYHEADVLAGAERTLREDRPELLVEWSTPRKASRERLYSMMQRMSYSIFQFEYGQLVPCTGPERHAPPSPALGANYVFVPSEISATAAA